MLLTQSQVSVFLSAVTIFFFTLALFLSGYVLQQKTLNNLRAAIRPHQPPPKLYIPSTHDAPSPLPNSNSISNNVLTDRTATIEITTTHSLPHEHSTTPPPPKSYKDILTSYFTTSKPEHTKQTPLFTTSSGGGGSGRTRIVNKVNKLIHRWIARVRGVDEAAAMVGADDEDESVPLESLSRAARRRRIKRQIRNVGDGEDVDMSKIYRPRKRAW